MPTISLINGYKFECTVGSSILNAAANSKLTLPYSCKTGRCSSCKCRVLDGATRALFDEIGLSDHEKAEGWILSCVRTAETDVLLEVDDLGSIDLPVPKTLPCRISEVKHLASDVIRVLLRLPPSADFCFIPGQYIDVIGPSGIKRSYSLASAGFEKKTLELHIRAVKGGAMSEYWFNRAKSNDLLRLNGPLGTFFLRETSNIDLIFLATGTGIAPVKAMLESIVRLSHDQLPKSISVFWGGRKAEDLYISITDIASYISYIPVLSRPVGIWTGFKGYVQDALIATTRNFMNAATYACGSDAMIHSARACLVQAGLPSSRFYSDAFVSSGTNK